MRSAEPFSAYRAPVLLPTLRTSAPDPRQAPDTSRFPEREHGRHDHQKREGAKGDKPPSRMARLVGTRRIDAVVGKRGLVEGKMDEQKHECTQPEPDDP